ncbi:coiled-coil domain-containing protein 170 [Apodemus sylvaticus]|uniref:coiled-coil domain-containing protein 170 n=1 Tax=Apodemus sylvaticus TaxID=10129 RepID=UPI002244B6D6|nr:coiled-coil domain-containing protein 170 [Apodemus sylvaticus]
MNDLGKRLLKDSEGTADHHPEVPVPQEQLNRYRNVAENVQSELAAMLVKFECAQSELRELRSRMLSKEACCQELKAEMESYKENSARKASLLLSLRGRIQELQEESAAFAASKIRAEASAHAMMKENRELTKKVLDLDEKLQNCSKESEESKKQGSEHLRRHEEFRAQLCDCLSLDQKHEEASDEDLILKLRDLCKENTFLKGQVTTLEETVSVHEMEAKANRETIMRLAAEVSREQTKAASWAEEKDKLNQDLLSAAEARAALEREAKLYQDRLRASQRAWEASKQELSQLRTRCQELAASLEASREAAAASQSRSSGFREKLAALLRSRFDTAETTEDAILERIRELGSEEENQKRMASQLEAQISELVGKLGSESESHQKALQKAHEAEKKLETLQGQLSHLEGELLSGDVMRDNLNLEKQKYLKFLDQLSEKMKLGHVAAELGFDVRLDVVLARIEQLVHLESSAVIENKTVAHNLQRKLKTQKERLESKEVHMNLLRQKIAQLQQEKEARSALAVDRDEARLALRKLEKKVERMQKELTACQEHNTELKAKLADTNELKIKTLEQTKAIEDLNQSRDELEKMKENAEKKLLLVMSELETAAEETQANQERSRAMVELASSEMRTLRDSLDEAERRAQQLAEFREVVSSMLGLNVPSLVLRDYEIIKCLERLIHSHHHHHHHHHFVPCACLKDMAPEQDGCSQCHGELPH